MAAALAVSVAPVAIITEARLVVKATFLGGVCEAVGAWVGGGHRARPVARLSLIRGGPAPSLSGFWVLCSGASTTARGTGGGEPRRK
jgi:hypothetical protein